MAAPFLPTRHHPEGAIYCFRSDYAQALILDWQKNRNGSLEELLQYSVPLARSIIQGLKTTQYAEMAELVSRIQIKLATSLHCFDATRGTAYSFVSKVIKSVLANVVQESRRYISLSTELDLDKRDPATNDAWKDFKEELEWRVLGIRTLCTLEPELAAQRWLVQSFLDCAFSFRRHEAANSCMQVFDFSHSRGRQLYHLTIVEIRRVTFFLLDHSILIRPGDLVHTKARSLIPYARYLSEADFTRLCVLLRALAPSIIFAFRPENFPRIRAGDRVAIRDNLRLVLWGHPEARPVFRA